MWQTEAEASTPTLLDAIELFGWPIVREVACVVLLHTVHEELGHPARLRPVDLDRQAVAVITAASEFGGSAMAALLANVGVAGMFAIGGDRFDRRLYVGNTEHRTEYERSVFGFDHGNLSAAMLSEADMPEEVCLEVFDHTAVGTSIWIAEHVAAELGLSGGIPMNSEDVQIESFTRQRFSASKMARLRRSVISAASLADMLDAAHPTAA